MATETKETSEAKHSPTLPPWVWQKFGDEWCLVGAYGMRPIILNVGNVSDGSRSKRVLRMRDDYHDRMIAADANHPDAKLIVRAVNSHAALVKACEAALAWRVSDFDTIAEMFYRETGYLRPGKDYPAGMGGETVRKEAADAWNIWVDRKNAELTDQLTTALAAAKEAK